MLQVGQAGGGVRPLRAGQGPPGGAVPGGRGALLRSALLQARVRMSVACLVMLDVAEQG